MKRGFSAIHGDTHSYSNHVSGLCLCGQCNCVLIKGVLFLHLPALSDMRGWYNKPLEGALRVG